MSTVLPTLARKPGLNAQESALNQRNRYLPSGSITRFTSLWIGLVFLVGALLGCERQSARQPQSGQIKFVTTIQPLGFILEELTGDAGEIHVLLGPGSSPHTYEPTPGDANYLEQALALFSVSENLDGWAAKLPAKQSIVMMDLLPASARQKFPEDDDHSHDHHHGHDHGHGEYDPHFWLDPMTVKKLVPPLVDQLIELDPEKRDVYTANGKQFMEDLDLLNTDLKTKLDGFNGRAVMLQHPSFLYFLNGYELKYAGAIEAAPGKEPTPQYIKEMLDKIKSEKVEVIFTEPQLSQRAAKVIAEEANIRVAQLDPIGGNTGRERTYADLLQYNADQIAKALGP